MERAQDLLDTGAMNRLGPLAIAACMACGLWGGSGGTGGGSGADVDAGPTTVTLVFDGGGGLDAWMATRGNSMPDLGNCTMTLSSVTLTADLPEQQRYFVHGSVTATLAPHGGSATGTVDLSASF
jgi:hypothetical protein